MSKSRGQAEAEKDCRDQRPAYSVRRQQARTMPLPPPLPNSKRAGRDRSTKLVVGLAISCTFVAASLVGLRLLGLLYPFLIPTGSMAPAVSPGDHVIMEGLTFLWREPRRGDIVAFRTDGIARLLPREIYDKRIVGEPGEHVQILDGKLYINDVRVSITNCAGEIAYPLTERLMAFNPQTNVVVPAGEYFLVGDNSTNSYDSRFWGCLPAKFIMGRICFCYWPSQRMGLVK